MTVIEPVGDVTLVLDPGTGQSFNVVLDNNGPRDIMVGFALAGQPAGVAIVPDSAVAKAKAQTTVRMDVGASVDTLPGEYTLELTVSQ